MSKLKVGICHYRVGGTDGVSLEIDKRKQILERYGCEVVLIAGERSQGADYYIKELEWDDGIVPTIKENGFLHFRRQDLDDQELKRKINKLSRSIEAKLDQIQEKEKLDYLLVHNIFSFGGHIAAAPAFSKWIKKHRLQTLATHHDFYWERKEYSLPRYSYLQNYLSKYMPPANKYIQHVVINTIARTELKKRTGLDSDVMPDVFDFEQKPWIKDDFNKDFLESFDIKKNDLVVLQATRVIPRKGIEAAIDYCRVLQTKLKYLQGQRLYNGKKITDKSRVILVVAGYAEDEKREYLFKLKSKAFNDRVNAKFISDHVRSARHYRQGTKSYSLWDAYVYADVVTFPSYWEGWGNQFIEAVFAKKPIVIYKYPVYQSDIEPEGYQVISLGSGKLGLSENGLYQFSPEHIKKAVRKSITWLTNPNLEKRLKKNYLIGQKNHGFAVLEDFLVKKLGLVKPLVEISHEQPQIQDIEQ